MQYWHLSGSTWPAAPTTELKMLTWPPDLLDLYPIDRKRQKESISICCQCRIERAVLQVLCPCLHGSSRVPQRPDGTGVGSVWKPGRHLKVLGPFLSSFQNVAGCTIGESSGVYFICSPRFLWRSLHCIKRIFCYSLHLLVLLMLWLIGVTPTKTANCFISSTD